jgi:hypothetical protein
MGIKRIVDTSFWTDGKVDDFSPEDKYFMLYLLTNPFSKQLGIYEISIKQAAFQMGYSTDAFNVLLDRFENKYNIIRFSKATNEIAILNFLRHSVMKGGKPVEDCIKKDMALVKNKGLIDFVFSRLHGREGLNETVKKIVAEYIKDNDIHNDNDNDNDNDRTWDESYHESSEEPEEPKRKRFVPPTLEEVKAYCLERKNNVDPQKFYDYFTASGWYDSKGKKVKSWKQKVITWEGFSHNKQTVGANGIPVNNAPSDLDGLF